ncbi:MAG: hypothetical protein HC838_15600 [Spirulinaceae cyanobacterium RM2_2_10]|nr:hypothetical protein [Spirulinaceae cyanobacterium RM2_2_10]
MPVRRQRRAKFSSFLHADARLPEDYADWVVKILAQPGVIAGAFELAIAAHDWRFRWLETTVRWRSRYLQKPYGDQALFLRAATFRDLGGFLPLPIMEDYELVQRLRRRGRVATRAPCSPGIQPPLAKTRPHPHNRDQPAHGLGLSLGHPACPFSAPLLRPPAPAPTEITVSLGHS